MPFASLLPVLPPLNDAACARLPGWRASSCRGAAGAGAGRPFSPGGAPRSPGPLKEARVAPQQWDHPSRGTGLLCSSLRAVLRLQNLLETFQTVWCCREGDGADCRARGSCQQPGPTFADPKLQKRLLSASLTEEGKGKVFWKRLSRMPDHLPVFSKKDQKIPRL